MKILIIDDERSIRNSLKEILDDEGYDVEVAENGQQGVEMVEKEKYDVIFCDIKMPIMDGTIMKRTLLRRKRARTSSARSGKRPAFSIIRRI